MNDSTPVSALAFVSEVIDSVTELLNALERRDATETFIEERRSRWVFPEQWFEGNHDALSEGEQARNRAEIEGLLRQSMVRVSCAVHRLADLVADVDSCITKAGIIAHRATGAYLLMWLHGTSRSLLAEIDDGKVPLSGQDRRGRARLSKAKDLLARLQSTVLRCLPAADARLVARAKVQQRLDQLAPKKPAPTPAGRRDTLWVLDIDLHREVDLDVTNCQHWGPKGVSGLRDYEVYAAWEYTEKLYRHPSGHWTLITIITHGVIDQVIGFEAARQNDEAATFWLVKNGYDVPADLDEAAAEWRFKPGPPPNPRDDRNQEPEAAASEKPLWQSKENQLIYRGQLERKVARSARNLRLVLDVFQEVEWADEVDSPFTSSEVDKVKLREAVRQLNKNLKRLSFESNGSGTGIMWKVVEDRT